MENSLLSDIFRAQLAKMDYNNKNEAQPDIGYPTGFLNLDYANGYVAQQYDANTGTYSDYFNIGVSDGSFIAFIGHTSTGKSTLMVQAAANIVRRFKTSQIWYDQTEIKAMNLQRIFELSRMDKDTFKNKFIIRNSGINIENVYERINLIYKMKTDPANIDKFLYNTGFRDMYGNPIIKMEPTIYIIDSLAMLMPEEIEKEDTIAGKTTAMQTANKVSLLMKQIMSKLQSANIILMGTNHIQKRIMTGPVPTQNTVPYLKHDESIPKGGTITYIANNIWRIDSAQKLKIDDPYHIEGAICNVSMVKSRNSGIKTFTRIVNNFNIGFDPWLSLLEVLRSQKRIYGAGVSYSLDPEKTFKFSLGNFKEKVINDPEFRKYVLKHSLEYLKSVPASLDKKNANDYFDELVSPELFTVN